MSETTSTRTFSIADTDVSRALLITRLFIEALNARDTDGLAALVARDVEFRDPRGGRSLRGRDAVEAVIRAAAEAGLRIVRRDGEEVAVGERLIRLAVPVAEFVGSSETDGSVLFDVRDAKIAAFEVSSEQL